MTLVKLINKFLSNQRNCNVLYLVMGFVVFFLAHANGMFWDNILFTSVMGNHLFENGLFSWNYPVQIDTGHPPFLAFLLASTWKVLGHKLWVTHLVILPFTIGFFYQLHHFIRYYIKGEIQAFLAFILVLADPTLTVQFFNVNPEIVYLFFFVMAINAILYKRYSLKIMALAFLSIISLRSMMIAAGLFLFESITIIFIQKRSLKSLFNKKFLLSYLIGSLPGIIYILWRLVTLGYIQTNPDSPWAGFWHLASLKTFIRNILLLGHRFLDFGRVFIFIFLIYSFIKLKKRVLSKEVIQLIVIGISSILLVSIINTLSTNTMGHRYFITANMLFVFLAAYIWFHFFNSKKTIFAFLFMALLTGNLWIYPRNIAQGWDASLAHLPYHSLRIEALKYLDDQEIPIEETGSFSINVYPIDAIDYSGDMRAFSSYTGFNKYLFYSNVFNLTDEQYENIDTNYKIIKTFSKFRIHIYIYKRKEK